LPRATAGLGDILSGFRPSAPFRVGVSAVRSMIYTLSLIGLVLLCLLALWSFRNRALHLLPPWISSRLRHYAPLSTFESAMEAGFSTSAFDLSGNVAGDSRAGLDERSLTEVRRIMEEMSLGFDDARLVRQKRILAKNGVDEYGYPMDPKAVTSLS